MTMGIGRGNLRGCAMHEIWREIPSSVARIKAFRTHLPPTSAELTGALLQVGFKAGFGAPSLVLGFSGGIRDQQQSSAFLHPASIMPCGAAFWNYIYHNLISGTHKPISSVGFSFKMEAWRDAIPGYITACEYLGLRGSLPAILTPPALFRANQ
ncbi:hypothetical protein WG66_007731 [Moniliophthora roreri]|nr:hypothetical protein WG66_007731 [Moniliophthora roreri]